MANRGRIIHKAVTATKRITAQMQRKKGDDAKTLGPGCRDNAKDSEQSVANYKALSILNNKELFYFVCFKAMAFSSLIYSSKRGDF
jgi:hypothetical protein